MSELTMVLQNPEDLPQNISAPLDDDCRDHPNTLPSPSSSSSLSSPSSPSTSALSTPANPNDDNSSEDKVTERTPFIDPEDVIGRRVMFDLPPLMLDSGWGVPPRDLSRKGTQLAIRARDLPSPEDDIQSTNTNFTNVSENEFPKELVLVDSLSGDVERGEQESYLLDGTINHRETKPETEPKMLSVDQDGTDASLMNDIGLMHKPKHLMEVLIYNDLCFLHWNWPLIRRACKVTVISIMIGMLCIAVALIATAPRTCEPARFWWQGGVVYEVSPATFQDSDGDGIGDLQGLIHRLDYISDLGVAAIRLNSIVESRDYPSKYWSVLNHTNIAPQLGTLDDFEELVKSLHTRRLRLILDFNPVFVDNNHPLVSGRNFAFSREDLQESDILSTTPPPVQYSSAFHGARILNLSHGYIQHELQNAIEFWLSKGIDGLNLKFLEHAEITPQLLFNLLEWRSILDGFTFHNGRKILICSGPFLEKLRKEMVDDKGDVYAGLFDMVDYQLPFDLSTIENLPQSIKNSTATQSLRSASPQPWILWSAGSTEESRLATRLGDERAFASILFQLLLPGTINIFAGDEVLRRQDSLEGSQNETVHQLVPWKWMTPLGLQNSSMHSWLSMLGLQFQKINAQNLSASLDTLKSVISLRNSSTPLYVAAMLHRGEREDVMVPNYKIFFHGSGTLVLERFYPRWSSFVVLANLGNSSQSLDLSSKFYQGKIIHSTSEKSDDFIFRDIHLRSGEALIVQL